MKNLISPVRAPCGIVFLLIFATVPLALGTNLCEPWGQEYEVTMGKPLVMGKPYVVPDLHLKFSYLESRGPVTPKQIRIFYIWWAYMDQDGRWRTHDDMYDCYPQNSQFVNPLV